MKNHLPLLLDAKAAAEYLGISERLLYELRKRPGFPPTIVLSDSGRVVRYRRTDLEAYVSSQTAARAMPEPTQLAAGKRRARGEAVPA